MAMTRFCSQALTRKPLIQSHPTISTLLQRHRSSKAHQTQLIEVDLESSTSSSSSNEGVKVISGGVRKLEEVLQSIIARRAAPDWLPFLPGYSYWVPPPPASAFPGKLIEVIEKVSAAPPSRQPALSLDESLSFSTNRGWPSSTYFIVGAAPSHPLPVEMKFFDKPEAVEELTSDNEEG